MIGPTPAAAMRSLRDALQVLLTCVTTAVLLSDPAGLQTTFTVSTRVRRSTGGWITLVLIHDAAVVSDTDQPRSARWRTRTIGYAYAIEDGDGREVLAYHWHPRGLSHFTAPHLHLGAGLCDLPPEMTRAHLHTGRITPVAVLALAVERYGAPPRRPDWPAIFERAARDLAE